MTGVTYCDWVVRWPGHCRAEVCYRQGQAQVHSSTAWVGEIKLNNLALGEFNFAPKKFFVCIFLDESFNSLFSEEVKN